jgi:hypothetical protein
VTTTNGKGDGVNYNIEVEPSDAVLTNSKLLRQIVGQVPRNQSRRFTICSEIAADPRRYLAF